MLLHLKKTFGMLLNLAKRGVLWFRRAFSTNYPPPQKRRIYKAGFAPFHELTAAVKTNEVVNII